MRSAASIEFSTQLHGKTVHWARNWLAALATRQASVLDLHQRQEAGMLVVKRSLISLDFHISADPKGGGHNGWHL